MPTGIFFLLTHEKSKQIDPQSHLLFTADASFKHFTLGIFVITNNESQQKEKQTYSFLLKHVF